MRWAAKRTVLVLLVAAAFTAQQAPARTADLPPGIHGPSASSQQVRHAMTGATLQALIGQRLRDPRVAALLQPGLRRLLGPRYESFREARIEDQPLRRVGNGVVGEGVVPGTLGYRGAFLVIGPGGDILAVIKGGRHGTTVERFGSLAPLADPAVHHAYQEFLGLDE